MPITWTQLSTLAPLMHTQYVRVFMRRHAIEMGVITFLLAAIIVFAAPSLAFADQINGTQSAAQKELELRVDAMINETRGFGELPEAETAVPRRVVTMPVSAYTSRPEETDDTPFIGAAGTLMRPGVVASNYFPLGTKLRIPELYGNQIFIVEDRMNARYNKRMDIWMEDLSDARAHGVQYLEVEVF